MFNWKLDLPDLELPQSLLVKRQVTSGFERIQKALKSQLRNLFKLSCASLFKNVTEYGNALDYVFLFKLKEK